MQRGMDFTPKVVVIKKLLDMGGDGVSPTAHTPNFRAVQNSIKIPTDNKRVDPQNIRSLNSVPKRQWILIRYIYITYMDLICHVLEMTRK